jgi:hypothetical protein
LFFNSDPGNRQEREKWLKSDDVLVSLKSIAYNQKVVNKNWFFETTLRGPVSILL